MGIFKKKKQKTQPGRQDLDLAGEMRVELSDSDFPVGDCPSFYQSPDYRTDAAKGRRPMASGQGLGYQAQMGGLRSDFRSSETGGDCIGRCAFYDPSGF